MAFILVLSALTALTVLAVPFLMLARSEHAASVRPEARAEVQARVQATLNYAKLMLVAGHEEEERLVQAAGGAFVQNSAPGTPDTDVPEEFLVPKDLLDAKGKPALGPDGETALLFGNNPTGVTTDFTIRDEQSYPNLVTSPFFVIAAALARSTLVDDLLPTDTEITVEDGTGFPEKNGHLLVGGEVISYATRNGGTFSGCQRGLEGGLRARRHQSEAWVVDDRAREIAMLPFRSPRAQGGWREPTHPGYLKEISLFGRDALTPNEVDKFAREFSLAGDRFAAGRFGSPETVRNRLSEESYDGNGFVLEMRSIDGFNYGTVVQISDGINIEYGLVAESRGGFAFGTLRLFEPTRHSYEAGTASVRPLLRHPVNINSASKFTLYRLIEGIHLSLGGGGRGGNLGRIDADAAGIVVDGILDNRPIRDLKHFRGLLEEWSSGFELVFNPLLAEAVFRNAVDATDRSLLTSTVPFCFKSSDHYTIDASAVRNDQSGRELARRRVRERVHVSPVGDVVRRLTTQAHFEDPMVRTRLGRFVLTHPLPVERWSGITSVPASRIDRMLYRFGASGESGGGKDDGAERTAQQGMFPSTGEGDVRLAPARMESQGYNQHFDGPAHKFPDREVAIERIDPEGWMLAQGPFRMNPRDGRGSSFGAGISMQLQGNARGRGGQSARGARGRGAVRNQQAGSLTGRTTPNPVRFDLWYRFGSSAAGRHVIYEMVGAEPDENRVTLVKEADQSLVARVHGRTLDDPSDRFEEVAETRFRPQQGGYWQPNTWYHFGVAYRGTKPEDVTLFIDGFVVGTSRYQTRLAGAFSPQASSFSVTGEVDDWPDRGVCWVGSEVVAYERSGQNFDVVQLNAQPWGRGQRGTRVVGHPSGSVVSVYGYSTLPRAAGTRGGVVIPRGGATLRDTLSHFSIATFQANHTININVPGPGGLTVAIPLEVHDPSRPNGGVLILDQSSLGTPDFDAFPASGGYILIVSRDIPVTGAPGGGIELAKYAVRAGNQLLNVQGVPSPPNGSLGGGLGAGLGGANPTVLTSRQIHPVRIGGGGGQQAINNLSCVFPISIAVSDASGYKAPERPQGGGSGAFGAWDTDPEFVQVGYPDLTVLAQHKIEWIRYHHIDPAGHLLCDEQSHLLGSALVLRGQVLGQGGIVGAHQQIRYTFPFRLQCGTDTLSDGRAPGGSDVVPCFRTVSHSRRTAINVAGYSPQTPTAPVTEDLMSAAGWCDAVTIESRGGRDRKLAHVAWAGRDWPREIQIQINGQAVTFPIIRNYDGHGWIAFTESPQQDFTQGGLPVRGTTQDRTRFLRLLKFPSGEMPDIGRGARAMAGGDADGQTGAPDGYIDELRVTGFAPQQYVVWDHQAIPWSNQGTALPSASAGGGGVSALADEIPVSNVEWVMSNPTNPGASPRYYILPDGRKVNFEEELTGLLKNEAGLVRIDDEIIAFRDFGTGAGGAPSLLNCQRGFMNTQASEHGFGANVVFLDFATVTKLNNQIDATSEILPVADPTGFFASGGTVLIDQEMIHYTDYQQPNLRMPFLLNEQKEHQGGMFRGRFGTAPALHTVDAIVLEMPYRYWDRYAPRQDSSEQAWFGFSLDRPGAFVHAVEFEKRRPGSSTDIELLCRTDVTVPWTADPARTAGLRLFTEDKVPNLINHAGDGLEVRVLFKYLSGAFDAVTMNAHDWKSTPEFESFKVTYLDQTRVLSREDHR